MELRTVARTAGLTGGLCWAVRLVVAGGVLADALHWLGLVLLAGAMAALGVSLVSRSALWLRVIVGVAFPLLVWSVLEVMHPAASPEGVDGFFGLVVAGICARLLLRARAETRVAGRRSAGARVANRRATGAHAR
jgi:hypothetical protein